ncbi:T9SS type A sorting domain-containing protein [bacterium]|nr:T9SS type A sorting domain-containing protein [bacterium]
MSIAVLFGNGLSADFDNSRIQVTLTSEGKLSIATSGLNGSMQIARTSIIAGETDSTVFDYTKDAGAVIDVESISDPLLSDFELHGMIDNSFSYLPPQVVVRHNIYAWDAVPCCLLKYTVINQQDTLTARLGLEILPQVGGMFGDETVEWMAFDDVLAVSKEEDFIGYKALTQDITSVRSFEYYSGYAAADSDLWNWLCYGQYDLMVHAGSQGAVSIPALDLIDISAGDSTEVWFAVGLGGSETEMLTAVDLAEEQYILLGVKTEPPIEGVTSFTLHQNYPNPFNGNTTICFDLITASSVTLSLFDIHGRHVGAGLSACPLGEHGGSPLQPGTHTITLSLPDLSSGTYFYQLQAGGEKITRTLHLIK